MVLISWCAQNQIFYGYPRWTVPKMVYACLKSMETIGAYMNYVRYGMIVPIGFLVLGGFSLILPVVTTLYILLRLPLPVL